MASATPSGDPPSKTDFIRTYLDSHPTAGFRDVNQAWSDAGYEGKISETLIQRLRSKKGLTGNLRAARTASGDSSAKAKAKPKRAAKPPKPKAKRGRPRKAVVGVVAADASSAGAPSRGDVTRDAAIEADFDRLLFQVMDRGMPDVEEAIRTARRLFVLREGD